MVQNAVVKRIISDDVVEVSLLRQLECGLHCDGACAGCGQKPKEEVLALAKDTLGVQAGDFVEVEPFNGKNIIIPIIVFLLPCITMAVGYLIGQSVLGLDDAMALTTAFGGLVLGFIPAFLMNRSIMRSKEPEFRILKYLR